MASIVKNSDEQGPFWTVRWREGGRGRNGRSRQRRFRRKGLADTHYKAVADREDRRTGGVPGGDGTWTVERFYLEKFLPLRGTTVSDGTRGGWERRWAPRKMKPKVWHVGAAWGGYALEDINYEAVLDWHGRMKRAGATEATMSRCHDLLVTILEFAVRLNYIRVNPSKGARPTYQPKRQTDVWLPDTIERIRQVFIDRSQDPRYRVWDRQRDAVLIAVLGYCALRPGEALALTWGQVLERSLWITHTIAGLDEDTPTSFEDGRTKTSKDRGVPMPAFLIPMLAEWRMACRDRSASGPVFPTNRDAPVAWTFNQFNNWRRTQWTPALKAAGVPYRRPYNLRHSCVTTWIYSGVNIIEAAARAGHSLETLTKTYAHRLADVDPSKPLNVEQAFQDARRAASDRRRLAGSSSELGQIAQA